MTEFKKTLPHSTYAYWSEVVTIEQTTQIFGDAVFELCDECLKFQLSNIDDPDSW